MGQPPPHEGSAGLTTRPASKALCEAHVRTDVCQPESGAQDAGPSHLPSRTAPAEQRRTIPHAYAGWQRHERRQTPRLSPRSLGHEEPAPAPQHGGPRSAGELMNSADRAARAAATRTERRSVSTDERLHPDDPLRSAHVGLAWRLLDCSMRPIFLAIRIPFCMSWTHPTAYVGSASASGGRATSRTGSSCSAASRRQLKRRPRKAAMQL